MPSPFPGMNPFLEQEDTWPDFHHRFIDRMAEAIAEQVEPRYLVKIEEHLLRWPGPGLGAPKFRTQVEPRYLVKIEVHLLPWLEAERQPYLEIRDRFSRDLITRVEFLSPTTKGRHRDQYLLKRDKILIGTAHLVEIDLLRGGDAPPAPDRPECDYSVMVSRVEQRPEAVFWPIGLREPLPVIPIPLRTPDQDATLDLQGLLHRVYDVGGYAHYIYEVPLSSPLSPEDEAWARQFVPAP
jgi:hypothetical protein